MSRQLEIFEDIMSASAIRALKGGTRCPAAAPTPPADSPATLELVPAAVPRVITTPDELLDMLRRRRDELGITHETIDHITGWASGYASKLLSPEPLKGLGEQSLGLVLDALALGIARIEFVENSRQADLIRHRWMKRRRPRMRPRRTRSQLTGALLANASKDTLKSTMETTDVNKTSSQLPTEG